MSIIINAINATSRAKALAGPGIIAGIDPGIVTVDGAPGQRTVRLHKSRSGVLVESRKSNPDGTYRFQNLSTDIKFMVVAIDDAGDTNAVVADRVVPVLPAT